MKTIIKKRTIIGLMISGASMSAMFGQSSNQDLNNRVEVIIDKEPVVQNSDKAEYTPVITEQPVKKEKYELASPDKLIYVDYSPTQLKAQGTKKDAPVQSMDSYIKIGFGSLLQPYVELNYNQIVKQKFTYGLKYAYTMAQGKLDNQKMNYHKGGLYAEYAASKQLKMGPTFNYDRAVHHFYGYHFYSDTLDYASSSIRQIVNNFSGKVFFENPTKNKLKLDYKQDIGFNYLFT